MALTAGNLSHSLWKVNFSGSVDNVSHFSWMKPLAESPQQELQSVGNCTSKCSSSGYTNHLLSQQCLYHFGFQLVQAIAMTKLAMLTASESEDTTSSCFLVLGIGSIHSIESTTYESPRQSGDPRMPLDKLLQRTNQIPACADIFHPDACHAPAVRTFPIPSCTHLLDLHTEFISQYSHLLFSELQVERVIPETQAV